MTPRSLSRRQFLQIVAVAGITGLTSKFTLAAFSRPQVIGETRLLMGTVTNLTVVHHDPKFARSVIRACFDQMEKLESLLSRFQPASQLSQLNREGVLRDAHPAFSDLVRQSQEISELSGGAFDISVKPLLDLYQDQANPLPAKQEIAQTLGLVDFRKIRLSDRQISFEQPGMEMTLDGIAKGYIVDAGTSILKENGFDDVLVEAGGDLMALGSNQANQAWQIGVKAPRKTAESTMARIGLKNRAAATSGDYMQPFTADLSQHHILDPRTGCSAPELACVTITAPSAMLADGLATAVMNLGPKAGTELLSRCSGCEGLLISKDMEITTTAGFNLG